MWKFIFLHDDLSEVLWLHGAMEQILFSWSVDVDSHMNEEWMNSQSKQRQYEFVS